MKKNKLLLFFMGYGCMALTFNIYAQEEVMLFPQGAPGEKFRMVEIGDSSGGKTAGESVYRITGVSEPSIRLFIPEEEGKNCAAVIVCPGGGYDILAYNLEGEEVCRWLNSLNITGVLLKYRVPRREGLEKHAAPLQDAQRAVSFVRANAARYGVDPERIGIMGFSAGGHLAAMTSNSFTKRTYEEFDEADKFSCRPDFCLLVYPAYLDGPNFSVAQEVKVSGQTPPTMLVQTEDDRSYIRSSLFYYNALLEAGVPAWMHLYAEGGHGYGLRDTGKMVNEWIYRAEEWFREINAIAF